jgi:hypothetical protein
MASGWEAWSELATADFEGWSPDELARLVPNPAHPHWQPAAAQRRRLVLEVDMPKDDLRRLLERGVRANPADYSAGAHVRQDGALVGVLRTVAVDDAPEPGCAWLVPARWQGPWRVLAHAYPAKAQPEVKPEAQPEVRSGPAPTPAPVARAAERPKPAPLEGPAGYYLREVQEAGYTRRAGAWYAGEAGPLEPDEVATVLSAVASGVTTENVQDVMARVARHLDTEAT